MRKTQFSFLKRTFSGRIEELKSRLSPSDIKYVEFVAEKVIQLNNAELSFLFQERKNFFEDHANNEKFFSNNKLRSQMLYNGFFNRRWQGLFDGQTKFYR